jgi:hypothetical protein
LMMPNKRVCARTTDKLEIRICDTDECTPPPTRGFICLLLCLNICKPFGSHRHAIERPRQVGMDALCLAGAGLDNAGRGNCALGQGHNRNMARASFKTTKKPLLRRVAADMTMACQRNHSTKPQLGCGRKLIGQSLHRKNFEKQHLLHATIRPA